jgi:hypothetical protein
MSHRIRKGVSQVSFFVAFLLFACPSFLLKCTLTNYLSKGVVSRASLVLSDSSTHFDC